MTAEELFNKHKTEQPTPTGYQMDIVDFKEALTEYRESIIKMIDEKEIGEHPELTDKQWDLMARGYDEALTEIKNKIEEMK